MKWIKSPKSGLWVADPTISVAASTDDCRVWYNSSTSTWYISLTSIQFQVGYASATALKLGGGMKFDAVNIPANATILTATLAIVAAYSNSAVTVNSGICGELDATAATFSTIADYQARRGTDAGGADNTKRTTARRAWDAIVSFVGGTTYTSPDFANVLQEMVDTLGALTDIILFWDDHDGRSTAAAGRYRRGAAWDNVTYAPPALTYTFSVPSVGGRSLAYIFG